MIAARHYCYVYSYSIYNRQTPAFRTSLSASVQCDEQHWNRDGDALVNLNDLTIGDLLNQQLPVRRVTCHRRPWCVCGLTMNVAERNSRYVGWRGASVVPVTTRPPVRRQSRLGANNAAITSNCSAASSPSSGQPASTPTSHNHVTCGGRSTSYSAAVVYPLPVLPLRTCTRSSTTKSMMFVPPLSAGIRQSSRSRPSAVSFGCSRRPRLPT